MPRAAALPTDVETLQELLRAAQGAMAAMSAQLRSRDVLIEHLKLQLARLKRMKVSVPAPTGWRCSLTIGMRLVHEAPEERELGA